MDQPTSGAGLRYEQAFLGSGATTAAARFSFDGRVLSIWLGKGYYLFQALFGAMFGPLLTVMMLAPGTGSHHTPGMVEAPLFLKPVLVLVMLIGWAVLVSAVLFRRAIAIDFIGRTITFTSYVLGGKETAFPFDDIQKFEASSVVRNAGTRQARRMPPQTSYLIGFRVQNGRLIQMLETTRQDVVRQIAQIILKQSRGHFELDAPEWATEPAMVVPPTHEQKLAASPWRVNGPIPVVAFAMAFLAFGAVLFSSIQMSQDLQKQHWPTTQGTVLSSRTYRDNTWHETGLGHTERTLSTQGETKFEYTIAGQDFQGTSRDVDVATRYSAGSAVGVSCNPKNFKETTINPGIDGFTRGGFIGGLVVLGGYVLFLLIFRKSLKKSYSSKT